MNCFLILALDRRRVDRRCPAGRGADRLAQLVFTVDAPNNRRDLCQQVLAAGGNNLPLVMEDQVTLTTAIQQCLDPLLSLAGFPRDPWWTARTIDTGHGRRPESRRLIP